MERATIVTEQLIDKSSVVVWCAHTGERSLDHGVCAPPCEAVHLRCTGCGAAIGGCPFEDPDHHERLARRILTLVGDETQTLLVLAIVEQAAHAGAPVTWSTARSVALGRLDQAIPSPRRTSPIA